MIFNKFPQYKKPIRLNLGCGKQEFKGFIGIDLEDYWGNMIWDVRKGIPFPDESVDEVLSCHFLEHLDNEEVEELFIEILRVLVKGGKTKHRLPYQGHPTAYYLGHKTFWNPEKITAMIRDKRFEQFEIIENSRTNDELFFTFIKK